MMVQLIALPYSIRLNVASRSVLLSIRVMFVFLVMLWLIETRIAHLYPTTQLWDNLDRELNILVRANTKSSKQVYQYFANEIRTHAATSVAPQRSVYKEKIVFLLAIRQILHSSDASRATDARHFLHLIVIGRLEIGQVELSLKETDNSAILCTFI